MKTFQFDKTHKYNIQESQQIPSRMNSKRPISRHIIILLSKAKEKGCRKQQEKSYSSYKKNTKMPTKYVKQKDKMYLMWQAYMLMTYLQKENMKKQRFILVKLQEISNKSFWNFCKWIVILQDKVYIFILNLGWIKFRHKKRLRNAYWFLG